MLTRNGSSVAWLALFTSTSTLVCCALPALMISLGAGATLAAIVSTVPQLIWISTHKLLTFGVSAALLAVGGYWQAMPAACPIDPVLARSCARAKAISRIVYLGSLALFLTGAFFAFVLPHLM